MNGDAINTFRSNRVETERFNPDGQVTEVSELAISPTELVGREVTVTCNAYTCTEGTGSSATTHVDTVLRRKRVPPAGEPLGG